MKETKIVTKESQALQDLEEVIENLSVLPHEEVREKLQIYAKNHKKLLQEVKLLTSVGDRLQKKIKSANQMLQEQAEEIQKINKDLQDKNIELQFTIDELTKAKAGKRATTIIFIAALLLFGLTEFLEWGFESFFKGGNLIFIYAFKVSLVIGFKPLEGLLEGAIIAREMRLQRLEYEAQQKQDLNLNIPKIEIKNNQNQESQNDTNLSPEELAKMERKMKREALKKMGENRE